jgi:xanthine dehydrogenase YagS FAD-binding subunit
VAATAADACSKLSATSLALSGGTNLLSLMKEHVLEPEVVVDLKRIDGMDRIELSANGATIGANATLDAVSRNAELTARYPALAQAIATIATPQIRNRSTIGGNLCGRPACWYFTQEAFSCLKRGGEGCPARHGENEFHAIFDTEGPCVIVHPSSTAPAPIALGAQVEITGAGGSRSIPLEEFFTSPSIDVRRENVLAANEIVTAVRLGPARPKSATYQVRQKASHDWPIALASVALEMSGSACRSARIVLGAVAPVPRRAAEAESVLAGKPVSQETAAAAATAALEGARPLAQNAYKVPAARAAVRRAILLAATGKWD